MEYHGGMSSHTAYVQRCRQRTCCPEGQPQEIEGSDPPVLRAFNLQPHPHASFSQKWAVGKKKIQPACRRGDSDHTGETGIIPPQRQYDGRRASELPRTQSRPLRDRGGTDWSLHHPMAHPSPLILKQLHGSPNFHRTEPAHPNSHCSMRLTKQ